MSLAIAAHSFTGVSETFIRAHVRNIAPDKTVAICQSPDGAIDLGIPAFSGAPPMPPQRGFGILKLARHFHRTLHLGMDSKVEDELIDFLKAHNTEAIMVEYLDMAVFFARVSKKSGIPLFAHAHGYDVSVVPNSRLWKARYRLLFPHLTGVFAPSKFLASRLGELGCPERKIHVTPCGVNPDEFSPSIEKDGSFVAVGRLVEKKAPLATINAFLQSGVHAEGAILHIIGDGPLSEQCRTLVSDRNATDAIVFHGRKGPEFVRSVMRKASVFLQHSVAAPNGDTEGLPVSILEAMSSELAVVSTHHAGIPEAVYDGQTGMLVNEHDVESMAMAIRSLHENPEVAKNMGRQGRIKVIEKFTQSSLAKKRSEIMGLKPQSAML